MRSAISMLLLTFASGSLCTQAEEGAPKPDPVAPEPANVPAAKAPRQTMKFGDTPRRYQFLITEAMNRFRIRDFKGAVEYVDRADEVLPPTAWSLNVRGAVAIELREFERGAKFCSDALLLEPGFFPARFNLCEIPFLQGQYAEARTLWLKLSSDMKKGDPFQELLTYRIFLTWLLEKDFERAKECMEKLPFPSQTPAYQYAHAAWARQNGDIAKWDEWVRSAAFIWPESRRSEFVDVLIQLGWMQQQ